MNNNLFVDAKFGDRFITRDGNMAIYIKSIGGEHRLLSQKFPSGYDVLPNGRFFADQKREYDIVGRWQELIDDDELDRLADELNPNNYAGDSYECGLYFGFQDGFAIGYRKAKEE